VERLPLETQTLYAELMEHVMLSEAHRNVSRDFCVNLRDSLCGPAFLRLNSSSWGQQVG